MRLDDGTTAAIWAAGLRKSYGEHVVLDGLDLQVETGTVLGLLGPNGAGKSTLVRVLSTLITPDAGQARVGGHDIAAHPEQVRRVIGVTGQFSAVDDLLTVRENLLLVAALHHVPRADRASRVSAAIERFGLTRVAGRAGAALSGGSRRRLDLAMTMVGRPRIIFLDEPTTGLDPGSRRDAWRLIRELADDGVTILLTTQYLDEADRLADRIAVLDQGTVVATGSPAELKRLAPGGHIRLRFDAVDDLRSAAAVFVESTLDESALSLQIPSDGGVGSLRRLLDELDRSSVIVSELSVHLPDLDDVFFALTAANRGGAS